MGGNNELYGHLFFALDRNNGALLTFTSLEHCFNAGKNLRGFRFQASNFLMYCQSSYFVFELKMLHCSLRFRPVENALYLQIPLFVGFFVVEFLNFSIVVLLVNFLLSRKILSMLFVLFYRFFENRTDFRMDAQRSII